MVSPEPDSEHSDQFPGEPTPRKRLPAGYAILITFTTLVAVLFLDANGLKRTAERQEPGFTRSAALVVMTPVQWISHTLRLDRPQAWLARATGHEESTKITSTEGVELADQVPSTTTGSSIDSTTTTTTLPPYRTPTAADPLRVLVAGDSLSGYLGPSLADALDGLPATVTEDEHVGTGLARPDVVDWPTEMRQDMANDKPDVVVVFMGGNDDQDLRTNDGWIPITKFDEWKTEYQKRIAQLMNIISQPGVSVYWVGMPAMGKAHLNKYVPTINAMARTEAEARPNSVTYVDAGKALNGPNGEFVAYLPDANGKDVLVRAGDGVHPTKAGMNRIVGLFAPDLIETRHLKAPPTTTTSPPPTG